MVKMNEVKLQKYTNKEMICVENHVVNYFGDIDFFINGIYGDKDVILKIAAIKPKRGQNYWILVTIGLGAYRMNIPKEYMGIESRTELVMYVQPDWKFTEDGFNSPDGWPVEILFKIAQIPIAYKGIIVRGMSIEFTSKEEIEYISNTNYSAAMIIPCVLSDEEADTCILPNNEKVGFSNVLPLYHEEDEYYQSNSLENMIKKIHKLVGKPVARERKNLC
jgi:hypothetical protein